MVVVAVGHREAEIDEALAPLMQEIWRAGIATTMSCQKAIPGFSWIEFESTTDLARFMDIVVAFDPDADTMYDRAVSTLSVPMPEGCWDYTLTPREIGGREGPEPTRYGDWEKNGRCIDF